jgi:5-methyltetrahydrofolate--homocysteine methyltransferase
LAVDELQISPLARVACDKLHNTRTSRAFVVGTLGTPKTCQHPDERRAQHRFEERRSLRVNRGAGQGGNDVLMVETIFGTLNAKAALFAIDEYFDNR